MLGCLDTTALNLAQGYVVEKSWADRLGTLALPFLWVLVSAVARGADDRRLSMHALSQLRRKPVWVGALGAGIILATVNGIIAFALQGVRTGLGLHSSAYLQSQGQFLDSIEASVYRIGCSSIRHDHGCVSGVHRRVELRGIPGYFRET